MGGNKSIKERSKFEQPRSKKATRQKSEDVELERWTLACVMRRHVCGFQLLGQTARWFALIPIYTHCVVLATTEREGSLVEDKEHPLQDINADIIVSLRSISIVEGSLARFVHVELFIIGGLTAFPPQSIIEMRRRNLGSALDEKCFKYPSSVRL